MKQWSPAQSLTLGFATLIMIGTVLLMLPFSSASGTWMPFIDALFTSTSAVTTTGLVVVDTGSYFSFFGQIVIMLLIQIGGLGYMLFIAVAILGLGRKLSMVDKIVLNESIAHPSSLDIKKFVRIVVFYTLFFEIAGAIFLTMFWLKEFPFATALYYGIFHSISGFCTAGFALFSDSFCRWKDHIDFNLINIVVCLAGGIGFFVHYDVYSVVKARIQKVPGQRISAYTKFISIITLSLISLGAALMVFLETWPESFALKEKVLVSIFHAVSASTTAGFNTVDISMLSQMSCFAIILLMFIGASSGSTGGGIKTSTFGVIVLFMISFFKGEQDVQFFKRRVPELVVSRAVAIIFFISAWLTITFVILLAAEKKAFLMLFFEMISAFSGTGLSMGITASLSQTGKLLMVLTMLVGRVGPLALGYSLLGKVKPTQYRNATAEMLVG